MLKVENLKKEYKHEGRQKAGIKNISFSVEKGEVVCILGPSGSGKSTLLKTMAGIEKPDKGSVEYKEGIFQTYVSQTYTLWPHLTVLENLTLAPALAGRNKSGLEKEARSLLNRFGLKGHADAFPSQLSGGQQQRVALLRAVIRRPDVLLLDEVTSAMDPDLIKSVLDLIRTLAKDGYTMLIVTHHVSFATSVADRVLFLDNGKIVSDQETFEFFFNQKNRQIQSYIIDLAKKDENIEVFKGLEQFQAYHLNLIKRLPKDSTIYIAGGVADKWYEPMGEFFHDYTNIRYERNITWKMVTYEQGDTDRRLPKENPKLNKFRQMPRTLQNPANYNVFGDNLIIQIFDEEPTIIQVKNASIAKAYLRFFEELWGAAKE
jgi:polar amino acid transport system ATP-binding protein